MRKTLFILTSFLIIFTSCKKENLLKTRNSQSSSKYNNDKSQHNREAGFEEYYQIIDFLEAYDNFIQNESLLFDMNITDSEWLMEAAINMRYGNTTRYVINLESEEREFDVNLNSENDSLLSFEDMMNKLIINMEWAQDVNNKELFFVDISYIGNGEGIAKFSIIKVFGELDEIIRSHDSPVPFVSGESYGAMANTTCNISYYGRADQKITNKINAATGNFGNTLYYNYIWINIHSYYPNGITFNEHCNCCAHACPVYINCGYVWGGNNKYACLSSTQMNSYLNNLWSLKTNIDNTITNGYKFYATLNLEYINGSGNINHPCLPGSTYPDYINSWIYIHRIAKLIPYPPAN